MIFCLLIIAVICFTWYFKSMLVFLLSLMIAILVFVLTALSAPATRTRYVEYVQKIDLLPNKFVWVGEAGIGTASKYIAVSRENTRPYVVHLYTVRDYSLWIAPFQLWDSDAVVKINIPMEIKL